MNALIAWLFTPIMLIIHAVFGGNRAAYKRAILEVRARAEEISNSVFDRCEPMDIEELIAELAKMDQIIRTPLPAAFGMMTKDDYGFLLTAWLMRNRTADMLRFKAKDLNRQDVLERLGSTPATPPSQIMAFAQSQTLTTLGRDTLMGR